ncbi:S8 family serine peptidase [Paenibacillus tyrfis]|uniref:S8 family serine peptidase n=1 Tax=Paenibacillus tyrfis TaxID=1501230 RepID=UPI00209C823D|nr:S8 family serine peptidase [Paenibacillus tyrfis]MCP1306150.1 S8 family serine peptidase [Paenibacillus tyrfis]
MPNKKVNIIVLICILLLCTSLVPHSSILAAEEAREVQISAYPTDPLVEKQAYLQQIHMNEAWDVATGNDSIVIAIVDTGVDLNHPDLTPNLVKGINLIEPGQPPRDDNGHGTNVAGIIGAAANNDKGIAGILWKAKLMPVKAVENDGTGSEAKLGEGIRYAVDHGAKIVVLSLGLNKYSDYMSEIVRYAETKGVLLVAATGNEGNTVKYPAAYPTVLAVGGMAADKKAHKLSNSGPEVDLVAPWDVFTTGIGGRYEHKDGTSMAAPQVAAVCALAWSKYPWMKPYQIRSLLRQTAEDLSGNGWSPGTGYGLLRADRVLKDPYSEHMYKRNDRKEQATPISVSKTVSGSFENGSDPNWFTFEAPYDGSVKLELELDPKEEVAVTHTDAGGGVKDYSLSAAGAVTMPVKKGKSYLKLQLKNASAKHKLEFKLTTSFEIYKDAYADNGKQYKAYVLPAQSQTLKGTFHRNNDQDWYMLPVTQTGKLSVRLSVDTNRMDPVLFVQKRGEKGKTIDEGGEGESEYFPETDVYPGDYYIRVSNAEGYLPPITGEYTLAIQYKPKLLDPNGPHDKPYSATVMQPGAKYQGLLDKIGGANWFSLNIEEESLVELRLSGIPQNIRMTMSAYNGTLKPVDSVTNPDGTSEALLSQLWQPGVYYIRLTADAAFDDRFYELKAEVKPLVGGYADVKGHWAEAVIKLASERKIIDGYEHYRFMPDRPITRAEATAVLVRGLKLTKQKEVRYTDFGPDHWAYPYIAKAAQAEIIDGYPDGSLAPDRYLTRMEMAAMMARSMKMSGKQRGTSPFADVKETDWGVGILKQLKAEGWIIGFPDGTFRPESQATRAEFVTLLARMMN